jgi:DNA repair protein RecO (recombination protein O)
MRAKNTKAVVLRKVLYKEKSFILTLFSEKNGLFSLFVNNTKKNQSALFSPFSEGEFVYSEKNQDRFFYVDSSIIDLHLPLRDRYECLDAASKIVKFLLTTQLPGKNSPLLYKLFSIYLKKIPLVENPLSLTISFYLKALKHDGSLRLTPSCSLCKHPAQGLFEGESFCKKDLPSLSPIFTDLEWDTLLNLLTAFTFEKISNVSISEELEKKILYVTKQ